MNARSDARSRLWFIAAVAALAVAACTPQTPATPVVPGTPTGVVVGACLSGLH